MGLPNSQRRTNFQAGEWRWLAGCSTNPEELLLEQRFGVTERQWIQLATIGMHQSFAKQIDLRRNCDIHLPAGMACRLLGRINPKL